MHHRRPISSSCRSCGLSSAVTRLTSCSTTMALARALELSLVDVAQRLEDAKARGLIWGFRNGQRPAPWYTDLELTVQGRRFLATHGADAT